MSGWLSDRGVDTLFYHQVDNPAVLPPDPLLVGWHDLAGSQMTTRVVCRRSARERMGVAVAVDGRTRILEYVDLPPSAAAGTDATGRLQLWAGNIAVHVIDHRVLSDAVRLPWHRVRRRVAHVSDHRSNRLIEPDQPNAWQFERFVFDLLAGVETGLVVEGDRASDFLPVKQASGEDSLESTRAGLLALHRGWLEAAGARVRPQAVVEISPGWALSAADVAGRVGRDDVFEVPVVLE
jgi:UDP-N-acetylglucosamine/UDP-N-acetylgalactosamine diphosphorylase